MLGIALCSFALQAVAISTSDKLQGALEVGGCSWDGILHDFAGSDVILTQYQGTTDAEKDASCCQNCNSNPNCQYWVRATDSTNCWLKKDFTGFSSSSFRRGNFRTTGTDCSWDGVIHDFDGLNVQQTQYQGTTDAEKDASCCQQCSLNPNCQYWVRATDSNACWLKKDFTGFSGSSVRRGNFKLARPCIFDGIFHDWDGSDVQTVQYGGTTEAEKDASCCQQCNSNPNCQYWVRATDSTYCWLKNNFRGFSPNPRRRGNLKAGACAWDGYRHDFDGSDVQVTSVTGSTDGEKDASCCQQCNRNPNCKYWVRATDSNSCWLKNNFRGFSNSDVRRGNWKAPGLLCADPTPPVNGNNGNCTGVFYPNTCSQQCNPGFQVTGGTWYSNTYFGNGVWGPDWSTKIGCTRNIARAACSALCIPSQGCFSATWRPGSTSTGCCLFPGTCAQDGTSSCPGWNGPAADYYAAATLVRACQADGTWSQTAAICST